MNFDFFFQFQEDPNDVLSSAVCVDENKILAIYLHDVKVWTILHAPTGEKFNIFIIFF